MLCVGLILLRTELDAILAISFSSTIYIISSPSISQQSQRLD